MELQRRNQPRAIQDARFVTLSSRQDLIVSALMRTIPAARSRTQVTTAVTMANPVVSTERMTAASVGWVRGNAWVEVVHSGYVLPVVRWGSNVVEIRQLNWDFVRLLGSTASSKERLVQRAFFHSA
jgi:hypothetical protein